MVTLPTFRKKRSRVPLADRSMSLTRWRVEHHLVRPVLTLDGITPVARSR